MLADISGVQHFYIIPGYTDMRKSIDGLCAVIEKQLNAEPDSTSLYLFCGRRRDRIKAILREPLSAEFCYPHIFNKPSQQLRLSRKNVRIKIS